MTLVMTATAMPAIAQEAEEPAPKENEEQADANQIVVTGFRQSVATAIEEKRNLGFIAEVVSADDIAGLPDVSIAESLARLPGVTSQRTGGQASAINIRGLSQDLVSASLNGREQVATSGDRVIEFNQYPSELIRQAAVYKTPVASIIAGGIAGRVELETVRPLDNQDDFSATINVRGVYNDRADESPDVGSYGYRASGSIQAKLADDTLGLALGYARLSQPNVATRFVQFDFPIPGNDGSPVGEDFDGNGIDDNRSFGYELIQFGGREERDGVIGVIQYEPVPELRILVDGYYSQFDSDVFRRGARVFSTQSGDTVITDATVVNDAVTGGTFTNQVGLNGFGFALGTELVNQDEGRTDELYTIGGNIAYDFSDRFTGAIDVSYSRGDSFFNNSGVNTAPFVTNDDGALVRADSVPGLLSTTFQTNGLDLPTISALPADYTDTSSFLLTGQFLVPQEDTDELFAVAVDFDYEFNGGFFSDVEFGARYSTRNAERIITSFSTFGIPGSPIAAPSELVSFAGFSGSFADAGFPDFAVLDIDGVFDTFFGPEGGTSRPTGQDVFSFTLDQSFTIDEDILAGYIQFNIDTIAGGLPLRGNIGLRLEHTDQSSGSTVALDGGNPLIDRVPVSAGDEFLDFLPSVNLILELSDQDQVRLSYTRQISRPSLFDLRGAIAASVGANNVPSGGGGNPLLRPFRANQFDISYERYFGDNGILAIAAFYKDLESFIVGGVVPDFNFADAGFQLVPNPNATGPLQDTGPLSAPINGSGGFVWGIEFNLTYSFQDIFPEPFDGLGVILNYAYSESDLDFPSSTSGQPINLPLPGLSESVANPTVYYEKSGFGARVGMRYRTSFVAPQIGISELIVTNASETVFDAQVSYAFPEDSTLEGFKILAQANNFTDEPTRSFFGTPAQTGTLQFFGRTFFLGATYEF